MASEKVGKTGDLMSLPMRVATRQSPANMDKQYFVNIVTNKNNTVLYTGMTNDLEKRVFEHKNKFVPSFTGYYNINKIVWYEVFEDPYYAITKEKQI